MLCKRISVQAILDTQVPYIKQVLLLKLYVKYSRYAHLARKLLHINMFIVISVFGEVVGGSW